MSRRPPAIALLVVALCAAPLPAQQSGSRATPVRDSTELPRAELRVTAGGDAEILVHQKSYLLLLEIIPYRGAAQLFPLSTAEGQEAVPEGPLALGHTRLAEARTLSARGVALVSAGTGPSLRRGATLRPRRLVLLASDQPFPVEAPNVTMARLAQQLAGLRSPQVFAGEGGDVDAIVRLVSPPGALVTMDVMVVGTGVGASGLGRNVLVTAAEGR